MKGGHLFSFRPFSPVEPHGSASLRASHSGIWSKRESRPQGDLNF